MNTIFTFGYLGSTVAALQDYVKQYNAVVVDIRFSPRSRRPEWNKLALGKTFGNGIYCWLPELGNQNYKNGGPILLADLEAGIRWIRAVLPHVPVILLCACKRLEVCHRKVAAEYLSNALGAPVEHLAARGEQKEVSR